MKTKQNSEIGIKVVPFRGEMYKDTPEQTEAQKLPLSAIFFFCACLFGVGIAIGATIAYNSPESAQFRELQKQSQKLTKIQSEICR